MKVLLSVLHFGLLRNFESLVVELSARGHEVLLMADEPDEFGGTAMADALAARPGVRWMMAPSYLESDWFPVARKLKQGLDYLRFLEPRYRDFPKLRTRAAERTPRVITTAARGSVTRRVARRALDAVERGMPRLPEMDALIARERPDVALFASITHPRAAQAYHLRSAKALGVPAAATVYSWDHLSSKSTIRDAPDRVFVWNEVQKREALEQHGIAADRIVVTGAQVYDQWFGRAPSRSRATFMAAMGLPPDRELLLYVCSAMTPDPRESLFVRRWLEAIRRSGDVRLREAAVIIRPHPERRAEWHDLDWSDLGPVLIAGSNPITREAKDDYFDALGHSAAVIGIVTSAFLEAAIAGRPVMTIMPPEFTEHQRGMLHFRYLLEVEDGILEVATSLDAHAGQLAGILNGDRSYQARQQRFLRAFVRPHGIDRPATPIFADAVEAMAAVSPAAATAAVPAWQRGIARMVVRSASTGWLEPLFRDAREVEQHRHRDAAIREHRREHKEKWRRHRRRKLINRVQWQLKKVRDLVR